MKDLKVLMGDDEEFESGIQPALKQHNTEQYVTATFPGENKDDKKVIFFFKRRQSFCPFVN